jgi:hypothetical protein
MFNTYSIIEWWNFIKEKNMKMLPIEVTTTENIITLGRHYILKELNCKTREDILKVKRHDLPCILYSKLSKIYYEVINILFPELNIYPWEMCETIKGYWDNSDNCNKYLDFILNKYIDTNKIDFQNDIYNIFTTTGLREKKEHVLTNLLYARVEYNTYYEWINTLHPEFNLEKDKFKGVLSKDNISMDSYEEKTVYEFIKFDLNLDIQVINRNKEYIFHNNKYNENYMPDFILNNNTIIEYFGLYNEKSSGNIIENYIKKTHHKVEFFSNLKEFRFIAIYPKDLNNNLKGLKYKINEYLKDGQL